MINEFHFQILIRLNPNLTLGNRAKLSMTVQPLVPTHYLLFQQRHGLWQVINFREKKVPCWSWIDFKKLLFLRKRFWKKLGWGQVLLSCICEQRDPYENEINDFISVTHHFGKGMFIKSAVILSCKAVGEEKDLTWHPGWTGMKCIVSLFNHMTRLEWIHKWILSYGTQK